MEQSKDRKTEKLRQMIRNTIGNARETSRAEASLCNLSFQSLLCPERHIWIDMCRQKIEVDLEDWDNSEEWDNTVEHHETSSIEEAIQIIERWINGPNSETSRM